MVITEDVNFPKLRDASRPNVEWLKAKQGPIHRPKASDGFLLNTPTGLIKVKELADAALAIKDGWTGTDEP